MSALNVIIFVVGHAKYVSKDPTPIYMWPLNAQFALREPQLYQLELEISLIVKVNFRVFVGTKDLSTRLLKQH